jgi:cyanuric acid amidohydrolase
MPIANVHRIPAKSPDDVSGIEAAVADGRLDPSGIVAILGKTEGNGCVNDFSRGFATQSLLLMLRKYLPDEEVRQVCLVMSGGTEGGMAPHWTVFERRAGGVANRPALAVGRAHTPALPFEGLGRLAQVDLVADGVRAAMRDADITDPETVHFVQVKCPLLTLQRIAEVDAGAMSVATRDTLKSMGLSRAASALGVAAALGEIPRQEIEDAQIGADWKLWSGRASCSAGIELLNLKSLCLACRSPGRAHSRLIMP